MARTTSAALTRPAKGIVYLCPSEKGVWLLSNREASCGSTRISGRNHYPTARRMLQAEEPWIFTFRLGSLRLVDHPAKVLKDSDGRKCESPQAYGECMCRCARATSLDHSETSGCATQCCPCGCSSNPFGCSKVPVDEEIHRTLTFFSVVWITTAFTSDVSRDASAWPRASRSELVASDLVI
jgi:hypothetical protein